MEFGKSFAQKHIPEVITLVEQKKQEDSV